MTDAQITETLIATVAGLALTLVGLLLVLAWQEILQALTPAWRYFRAWVQYLAARIAARLPQPMSSRDGDGAAAAAVDAPVVQPAARPTNAIALPNKDDKGPLPVAAAAPPDNEQIAWDATVAVLAALRNAGQIKDFARSIEVGFGCSRAAASKPESTYQRAKRAIEARLEPSAPKYRELDEERRTIINGAAQKAG